MGFKNSTTVASVTFLRSKKRSISQQKTRSQIANGLQEPRYLTDSYSILLNLRKTKS